MTPRTPLSTLIEVENRICDELAAAGRSLTTDQVQRLVDADRLICDTVLDALVRTGMLRREADGCVQRRRTRRAVASVPESRGRVDEHA